MPFYQVGNRSLDAVILGRCYVYPPGSVLWFPDQLPAALNGLVAPLELPPDSPLRVQLSDHATPPIPKMETKG